MSSDQLPETNDWTPDDDAARFVPATLESNDRVAGFFVGHFRDPKDRATAHPLNVLVEVRRDPANEPGPLRGRDFHRRGQIFWVSFVLMLITWPPLCYRLAGALGRSPALDAVLGAIPVVNLGVLLALSGRAPGSCATPE